MKICLAQTFALKGDVQQNIQNHLQIIDLVVKQNADLIIFPELSITAYEPEIAAKLATHKEDSVFDPFQAAADQHEIAIGVGMPTLADAGIHISLLFFQAHQARQIYSKQMLHVDEEPYFICGTYQSYLNIKGKKIAFGICYESLQHAHFLNAHQAGADIYIASVAKPQGGVERAYAHFPNISKEFNTPILMSNCVGFCDNFLSVGQSAVWDGSGNLVARLDRENQGILIYDTGSNTAEVLSF